MQRLTPKKSRILVVDDNRAIHDDFRKILSPDASQANDLEMAESALFGAPAATNKTMQFDLDSAYQGKETLELVRQAVAEKKPYALAFVDVRMPPGWDGIETTAAIWKLDPDIQIVICTAYSDYSWDDLHAKLGHTDRLVILKKPFDNVEVLQLAHALSEKWRLLQQTRRQVFELEERVDQRTAQLQETNRRLETEITERKQAEFALLESQQMVLRQERLAAVGQLSAGVAHDFNNIMTVIHGHASLLLLGEKVSAAAHEPLREIEKAAMRAAKLTQQLLAFSRKQAMQPRPVNLGEIAGGMAAMLERAIGEHIRLHVTAMPGSPAVQADASMIEQVLMNLAVNARDARPDGGSLSISVEPSRSGRREQPGIRMRAPEILFAGGCGTPASAWTNKPWAASSSFFLRRRTSARGRAWDWPRFAASCDSTKDGLKCRAGPAGAPPSKFFSRRVNRRWKYRPSRSRGGWSGAAAKRCWWWRTSRRCAISCAE